MNINQSQVRRAITTLKKNGLITKEGVANDDFLQNKVTLIINIDGDLLIPKQRKLKPRKKDLK